LGSAIGDYILDLRPWLDGATLNGYLKLRASERRDLRHELSRALEKGAGKRDLLAQSACEMLLPVETGDYTDFYASLDHATNVGRIFRPQNPLLPNYKHIPLAYHGRASSVVVSGTPIPRPRGQLGEGRFGPTAELDYELELGVWLGPGNKFGQPIPIEEAEPHIAGVCLLNDWSARDVQRWEYQPLGPFLSKSFATSVSPWLITLEALEPFRVDTPPPDTAVLPYLQLQSPAAFAITLEAWLGAAAEAGPVPLSRSCFSRMYWTLAQMVAHQTSNGCPIRPGDLFGTGTVSGPEKINRGCLLELTSNGREPLTLPSGSTRTYLADGDEVILRGTCERAGYRRIGLGGCRGTIVPAP
jgi:fumarylacetoacetase